jgi:hypothetical protein
MAFIGTLERRIAELEAVASNRTLPYSQVEQAKMDLAKAQAELKAEVAKDATAKRELPKALQNYIEWLTFTQQFDRIPNFLKALEDAYKEAPQLISYSVYVGCLIFDAAVGSTAILFENDGNIQKAFGISDASLSRLRFFAQQQQMEASPETTYAVWQRATVEGWLAFDVNKAPVPNQESWSDEARFKWAALTGAM